MNLGECLTQPCASEVLHAHTHTHTHTRNSGSRDILTLRLPPPRPPTQGRHPGKIPPRAPEPLIPH